MFEFIRNHQRLMQFLLLLFIVPSFAFLGMESYTRMGDKENIVAKVDGQPITRQEWESAQRQQSERFRQMFGEEFDPAFFSTPEVRQGVLENLISQRALIAEARRHHLAASDQALQEAILAIPGLVTDGTFDNERYRSLLAAQGMTPAMYEAGLRQELVLQQLNGAIQNTAFSPKTVAKRLSDLNEQERVVQEQVFNAADFASKVTLTPEMVKDFYKKNDRLFQVPEKVAAEYVVLSQQMLEQQMTVSESDVRSYYEQNAKLYTTEEQRRARHILISVHESASAKDKATAKTKANDLRAQLQSKPDEFARLAKENSDDPGSAEQGGDLGFFDRGMMVPEFEKAAYALNVNEISPVVESDFGFHIIQLVAIKPGATKSLAEVKDEIEAEIRKQKSARAFTEMAETLSNTVYEQPDSLKPVAEKLDLKIEKAADLTRQPNPGSEKNTPYNQEKFLSALFSEDVLKDKHNTEAIEVGANTLIAGRVVSRTLASKLPFEEVEEKIRERLTKLEAVKLATQAGETKLATESKQLEGFSKPLTVSRANPSVLPEAAFVAVMKAAVTALPAYVGVEVPQQGYRLYRINAVQQSKTDDTRRKAERQQITEALAQQQMLSYIEILKKQAKVEVLKPVGASAASEP